MSPLAMIISILRPAPRPQPLDQDLETRQARILSAIEELEQHWAHTDVVNRQST